MQKEQFVLHDFVVQSCLIDAQFDEYGELMPATEPGQLMYDNTVRAFELIQTLAQEPFYAEIVKDIHRCLTKHIDWFENNNASGVYRNEEVQVDGRRCPKPMFIDFLIRERWYQKAALQIREHDGTREHALEIAWHAHHAFEYIHPFLDGNGRTGRLLLNYLLIIMGQEPIVIWHDEKESYYESIRAFDQQARSYLDMDYNWPV